LTVQQSLNELLNVSADVTQAAVLDAKGRMLGASGPVAERLGKADLDQIEVCSEFGAVFVVREGEHSIVALTGSRPVSGLVFYDLRACLHDAFPEQGA
jgi:predicted regulator of Ras-like GTPase activity (Roadblock/LC7/MglB family)